MDKGCLKAKKMFQFENKCHKRNFIITLCVYFNFILLGWTYGQLGTAFVDIQQILSTSVQQTSLIFTMNSCGYMLGSLLIGALYDRVPKLKLLGLLTILNGVTSALLPWCSSFGLFLFVRLVDGTLCGGRDGGGNAKVSSCWGFAVRPYMQALHFTYAFGGIISPIVTSHFLAPRITLRNPTTNVSYGNGTNTSAFVQSSNRHGDYNNSMVDDERAEHSFTVIDTDKWGTFNNSNSIIDETVVYGESHVHIAFAVTGILTALSGCLYLVLYGFGYETIPSYQPTVDSPPQNVIKDHGIPHHTRASLSRSQTVVFLIVFGGAFVAYCAIECKYQSFIMPYVTNQLKWTKQMGAFLIALVWASFGSGRFVNIFISRFVSSQNMIIGYLILLLLASAGVYLEGGLGVAHTTWIMVPLAAFAMAPMYPTFIVWIQENIMDFTGKISGIFMFTGALGFMIDPLYIGYLMEHFSPLYLIYINVIQCSFCLGIVLLLTCQIRKLKRKIRPGKADEIHSET